jgi:outer membrane receptor protein involved in Fe transport
LVNYNAENLKLNAALHYRISDNLEAILQGNYGTGTTVNTAADRYSLTGFDLAQFKLELKGANFFLRGYTTQERSGDSYAAGTFGELLNEAYSPSQTKWFPEYTTSYLLARLGMLPGGLQTNEQSHTTARSIADRYRLIPGTPEFNEAKSKIINTPLPQGARFTDKTNLYHVEGMFNFSKLINFAEIIVGANYRIYDLNSEGTVFLRENDSEEYNIDEYGGYIQASKKVLADKLKLTGSIRYDKNENFKGQFSPRLSGVYTFAKTHNIRLSYQTGFRIPATQDQYINLVTPQATLIGGLPIFRDRYNFDKNPVYSKANVAEFGAAVQASASSSATVQQATQQAMADAGAGRIPATQQAIAAAAQQYAVNIGIQSSMNVLQPYQFKEFKPEHVQSYEIGYKSLIADKLMIDSYYYFNSYKNFSGQQIVIQANPNEGPSNPAALLGLAGTRTAFVFPESSSGKITSHGWALGLDYALPANFMIGGNVAYNALIKSDPNLAQTQYNTPRFRSNISLSNRNITKNIGFNIVWHWQDAFVWETSFTLPAKNTVVAAFNTFDAQVSCKIPSIKSILKIGGSNLLNKYYTQAFGNPSVGGLYYISLSFDELLR